MPVVAVAVLAAAAAVIAAAGKAAAAAAADFVESEKNRLVGPPLLSKAMMEPLNSDPGSRYLDNIGSKNLCFDSRIVMVVAVGSALMLTHSTSDSGSFRKRIGDSAYSLCFLRLLGLHLCWNRCLLKLNCCYCRWRWCLRCLKHLNRSCLNLDICCFLRSECSMALVAGEPAVAGKRLAVVDLFAAEAEGSEYLVKKRGLFEFIAL